VALDLIHGAVALDSKKVPPWFIGTREDVKDKSASGSDKPSGRQEKGKCSFLL
jgi:hypothetical protein